MTAEDRSDRRAQREERLARAAREALGGGRRLTGVERISGGTTKGVFRLTMDDASTAVAYLWEDAENYWPKTEDDDPADTFSQRIGIDLFEASQRRLRAIGVRTVEIYLLDREGGANGARSENPADLAIVEDLPGEQLEQLLHRDPQAAAPVMDRLAESLGTMREQRAPTYGRVAVVDAGGTARGTSCEGVILEWALRDLAEAAARDRRIADARDRLEERLHTLHGRIAPRAQYAVVHGELGPDHVRIDAAGNPVIIDIEGLMYFDVEWEHVFLWIRLQDEHYRRLAVGGLDQDRLALYTLAQRLSLTAGPLRLLDGPFPDRRFMQEVSEFNLNRALELAAE
jgi:hypothetical protein